MCSVFFFFFYMHPDGYKRVNISTIITFRIQLYLSIYLLVRCFMVTHSTEGLKLFVRDKATIQTKEEYRGVGQHASQDDQVVHVWTGHLNQPGRGQKIIGDQNSGD